MNFLLPVLAAFLQATSLTLDKIILSVRKVDFKMYVGMSFPLIFFITLIIFLVFRPPLSRELIYGNLFWWLVGSITLSIFSNLLFYKALDQDKLGELETISLLSAIPVIIFSSIFFTDERNFSVLIPAFIASAAVIWSHWKAGHFLIKKDTLPFLLGSLVVAPLGAACSKILLADFNPISLELLRSGALALILTPLFQRKIEKIPEQAVLLLILTNILTTVAWILFFFSYQKSGIVYTVLLFSIQPLLVYIAAIFFLKEKFDHKKFIAFLVVLASIAIAQIFSRT